MCKSFAGGAAKIGQKQVKIQFLKVSYCHFGLFGGRTLNTQNHGHNTRPPEGIFKKTYVHFDFCVWATTPEREMTPPRDTRGAPYKKQEKKPVFAQLGVVFQSRWRGTAGFG